MVAAEIRKIIKWGSSNESHLRSLADTITDVVRTEKTDVLIAKSKKG
jgi:hypothetical protein